MGKTNTAFTWQGQPRTRPTTAECIQSCVNNAEEAGREQSRAAADYERFAPGTKELLDAHYRYNKAKAEQAHWRGIANWHREKLKLEQEAERRKFEAAELERRRAQEAALAAGEVPAPSNDLHEPDAGANDLEPWEEDELRETAWSDLGYGLGGR